MYIDAVSILNTLKKLESERDKLMKTLLETQQMIRGKFGVNYRRCGTHTCWCYKAKRGHPHERLAWGENGKTYTRMIPDDEIEWAKEMTANYKRFRAARKRLRDINEEIRMQLNKLEIRVIEKTKKGKKFL